MTMVPSGCVTRCTLRVVESPTCDRVPSTWSPAAEEACWRLVLVLLVAPVAVARAAVVTTLLSLFTVVAACSTLFCDTEEAVSAADSTADTVSVAEGGTAVAMDFVHDVTLAIAGVGVGASGGLALFGR